MSRLSYDIKPALFDIFARQSQDSLKREVARILMSRNLSKELTGINSSFGIPTFSNISSEDKTKIEYAVAYHIMTFENRLDKATVKITSIQNGKITTDITLYPTLHLEPLQITIDLQL